MIRRERPSRAAGFSLIELLVVVAILALLVGLVVPAIGVVRNSANTSRCQSNLRQLFLACQSYAQNHHGVVPASQLGNSRYWGVLITPYLDTTVGTSAGMAYAKTNFSQSCPEFRDPSTGYAYGPNCTLGFNGGTTAPELVSNFWPLANGLTFGAFHATFITASSQRLCITDIGFTNGSNGIAVRGFPGNLTNTSFTAYRHRSKANLAFVDGHLGTLVQHDISQALQGQDP